MNDKDPLGLFEETSNDPLGLFDSEETPKGFSLERGIKKTVSDVTDMAKDLIGVNEAGLNLATAGTTGPLGLAIGTGQGFINQVREGTLGNIKEFNKQGDYAMGQMDQVTYNPKSELGQEYSGKIGKFIMENAPALVAVAPQLEAMAHLGKPAIKQITSKVKTPEEIRGETPKVTPPAEDPLNLWTPADDVRRQYESYTALEQSIVDRIESLDPTNVSEMSRLAGELDQVREVRAKLSDYFEGTDKPMEPTIVGPDVDTTTGFNPYGKANQEGNKTIDVLADVDPAFKPVERGVDPQLDALVDAFPQELNNIDSQTLSDRYSVNEAINAKTAEYSKYSPDVLERMIKNKDYKLGHIKDEGLRALIQQEKELLEVELTRKRAGDAHAFTDKAVIGDNTHLAKLTQELDQVVRNSDDPIRSGLDYLASKKGDPALEPHGTYLGELADQLRNNPNIGRDGLKFDPTMTADGSYSNMSGQINMNPHNFHAGTFLHEVVHSAVNKVMTLVGEGKVKDLQQVQAVRNIEALYANVKDNFGFILDKYVPKEMQKFMMENPREFVAYGLTNSNMIAALKRMRLSGESGFSKFKNTVMNLLGLSDKARTAFSELLENGGHLIDTSTGEAIGRDLPKSFAQANTPTKLLAGIRQGALNIFAHGFTAQLKQMMKNDVHAQEIFKITDIANKRKESLDQVILYGKDTFQQWEQRGVLNTFKLSAAEKPEALVPSMYKLKGNEIHDVYSKMIDGMLNKVDPNQTFATHSAGWSQGQQNFAKALINISDKLLKAARGMQAGNNLKQLQQLMGYILTSRAGDHAVTVSYRGVPLRLQRYMTKAEAEHWQQWFRSQSNDFEVRYDHTKNYVDHSSIVDFLEENLANIPPNQLAAELQIKLDRMIAGNSNVGVHSMQTRMLAGFIGDQVGLTPHQLGERLRESLPRAVKAYTQNIASRDVHKKVLDYYDKNSVPKNTSELMDFYVRTQTEGLIPEGSIRETLQTGSKQVREFVDTIVDKNFGEFHGRDKHALDRFTGLFGNAFYTANITMKPAIWIAQPLQAFMSARSAFKNGESPRQVLAALGQTVMDMAGGKKFADPEYKRALFHAVEDGNTLHPQMTNEFNDWKIGTDPNTAINKVVNLATGRTISTIGDKFSRFSSFTFFYNLHKRSGLKGEELARKAAEDTTTNMIGYGSKNMPAIYREMGIFGEQSSPLATFAHGQAGNLIVDVVDFMKTPSARTAAPLIMTGAVIAVLGGVVSFPLIAEYEIVRQVGLKNGWWGTEWPDATQLLLVHAPSWVSHGALSDATGMDIDASMRYTSLMQKITNVQNQGMLSLFPPLAWGAEAAAGVATLASDAMGKAHTPTEIDKAVKATVPKGILGGMVDQYRNDGDLFNPDNQKNPLTRMGNAGKGGVERTDVEKKAPFFGTRSLKESLVSMESFTNQQRNQQRTNDLIRAAQLYSSGNQEKAIQIMMKHEKHPTAAANAIKAQIIAEKTPAAIRGKVGKSGTMSYEQARDWKKSERTPFLEKLRDSD